jgi:BirA family transcriptional regulator, biotin operon repressor / biotin---[acetyl-CoA-carboxylase] ligase
MSFPKPTSDLAGFKSLPGLAEICYFESLGSSNDEALAWAAAGARDMSLVVADEQTSGRGRMGRKWFTPRGAALAFSLVIRPKGLERDHTGLFSGLGALALVETLKKRGVAAQIKWPNDVLINRKKVAGILVETVWLGNEVDSVVLGMGVNVRPDAVPPDGLNFPATCIQSEGLDTLSRVELLSGLLAEIIAWRPRLASDEFMRAWQGQLAFRGETVQVWEGQPEPLVGQLLGLETDGSLRVVTTDGRVRAIRFGEVHLRPV